MNTTAKPRFVWDDPLLEAQLSAEERLVRDAAFTYARDHLTPRMPAAFRNEQTDPGGMVTRARKIDGGYRLNGTKTWISNAPFADVFMVWAKLEEDGKDVIRGFVLEKGWTGLSTPPIHGKIGLRASPTGEVVMDGVFVSAENRFHDIAGLKGPFTGLNAARYGITGSISKSSTPTKARTTCTC